MMKKTDYPITSLRRTLSGKYVTELRELAKSYYVKRYSKMKKDTLVEAVFDALLDMGRLMEIVYVIDPKAWALFQRAAKENVVKVTGAASPQYKLLVELGYLERETSESGTYLFMPDEIKALLFDLIAGGLAEQKELFDRIHAYAQAATNLYGVISLMEFAALYNGQNEQKVSVEEMMPALLRHISADATYCIWEQHLINEGYQEDSQKAVRLLHQIGDTPRYIPDKAELLRYGKADYFEKTEHTEKLERYLTERLKIGKAATKKAVTLLHFACQIGAPVDSSVRILYDYKENIEARQMAELSKIVEQMFFTTRLPVYNGHTAEEMQQLSKSADAAQRSRHSQKVGRNDPCPCGSGRKYKKCCGR